MAARPALGLVVLAVCVGWGAALAWPALSGAPAGATARAVAALAGLPPYAGVGVAGTLLIGVLQARRGLLARPRPDPPAAFTPGGPATSRFTHR